MKTPNKITIEMSFEELIESIIRKEPNDEWSDEILCSVRTKCNRLLDLYKEGKLTIK